MPLHEFAMKSRNANDVTADKNNNSVYLPNLTSKPFTNNYSKREFSEPPIQTSSRIFSPEINTFYKRRLVSTVDDEQKRLVKSTLSQKYDLGGSQVKNFKTKIYIVLNFDEKS